MRLDEWAVEYAMKLVFGARRWMGVPAAKNALDAWAYQEVIHATRPTAIVELGSLYGGGTLFLANMLDLLGEGIVVSVDIDHSRFAAEHDRITLVTGDSGAPEVVDRVRALCQGRRTMVIHDAAHEARLVLRDLHSYSPLVSPGCYLVVEDGIIDAVPSEHWGQQEPGPLRAIEEFLLEHPEFRDDERFEQPGSFNPRGYLLRT